VEVKKQKFLTEGPQKERENPPLSRNDKKGVDLQGVPKAQTIMKKRHDNGEKSSLAGAWGGGETIDNTTSA